MRSLLIIWPPLGRGPSLA